MRKQVATLLTAVFLISFSLTANAAIKPGTLCKKLGSTSIYSGKKYTCIKSGNRFYWSKGTVVVKPTIKPSPTPSLTSTPTASPSPSIPSNQQLSPIPFSKPFDSRNSVYYNIQQIIDTAFINSNESTTTQFIFAKEIFSGSDGKYEEYLLRSLKNSINIYKSLGFKNFSPVLKIQYGRSQDWFKKIQAETCGLPPEKVSVGAANYFGCMTNGVSSNGIIVNIGGIVSQQFTKVDTKLNLDSLELPDSVLYQFYAGIPHEIFHDYQLRSSTKVRDLLNYVPPWFQEGTAVVMSNIVFAIDSKNQGFHRSYVDISNSLWLGTYQDSLKRCKRGFANMDTTPGRGCQYTQGARGIEYLIANFGGIGTIKALVEGLSGNGFDKDFENVVGISLAEFYRQVDLFGKDFGFALENYK